MTRSESRPGRRAHVRSLLAATLLATACGSDPPPDVVVVVLDTVRADRLSCYGYARQTTPRIDALAASGILYEDAASTSSWTVPAHASLFTGLHPIEHGATQEHPRLDASFATLAEHLKAAGYATFAASANPLVSRQTGLARGFDRFAETWRRPPPPSPERHPNLAATRRFLASLEADRPVFLFLNFIEAHSPYAPPEPHRSRFLDPAMPRDAVLSAQKRRAADFYLDRDAVTAAELRAASDLYDGELARLDTLVGALLDLLERSRRRERALVWITSDHGENLGDHGHLRHLFSLYRTTVHVPLIAVLPGGVRGGERRPEPVSLADLFGTVLAQAGLRPPPGARDLLGALPSRDDRAIFAEYYFPLQALAAFDTVASLGNDRALAPHLRRLRSVRHGDRRLIWSSDGRHELYALAEDPEEREPRVADPSRSEEARRLHALLEAFVAAGGGDRPLPDSTGPHPTDGPEFDAQTLERLRELGYVR